MILKSSSQLCQCNFAPSSSVYKFMSCKATGNVPVQRNFLDVLRVLAASSSQHREEARDLCSRNQEDSETTPCTGSQVSCGSSSSSPCLSGPGHLLLGLSPLFPSHPSALLPSLRLGNTTALGLLQLSTCMS